MSGKGKEEASAECRDIEGGYESKKKGVSKDRARDLKVLKEYFPKDDATKLLNQTSKSWAGWQKVVRWQLNR